MAPSYAVAVSLTGPLLTVLSMSGGLFTNVDAMPSFISWVQYISWSVYFLVLLVNFRSQVPIRIRITDCHSVHRFFIQSYSMQCKCMLSQWNSSEERGEGEGRGEGRKGILIQVIESLHFSYSNLYGNLVIMLIYSVVVYAMGYVALVYRVLKSR